MTQLPAQNRSFLSSRATRSSTIRASPNRIQGSTSWDTTPCGATSSTHLEMKTGQFSAPTSPPLQSANAVNNNAAFQEITEKQASLLLLRKSVKESERCIILHLKVNQADHFCQGQGGEWMDPTTSSTTSGDVKGNASQRPGA